MASEYSASVNRVMWSPDGTLFGMSIKFTSGTLSFL